jgi:hypothetical protein
LPFAFNPDDGPPRLIRFAVLSADGVVSVYDREQNLLVIDPGLFAQLSWLQKHQLLRTHAPITEIHDLGDGDVLLAA